MRVIRVYVNQGPTAATWATVALAAALVGVTLYYAIQNRRMALAMGAANAAQEREAERRQADRVAFWVHSIEFVANAEVLVTLRLANSSGLPVFDLEVRSETEVIVRMNVLPPGDVVSAEPRRLNAVGIESPRDIRVEGTFRDAAGKSWVRSADGTLTREA